MLFLCVNTDDIRNAVTNNWTVPIGLENIVEDLGKDKLAEILVWTKELAETNSDTVKQIQTWFEAKHQEIEDTPIDLTRFG